MPLAAESIIALPALGAFRETRPRAGACVAPAQIATAPGSPDTNALLHHQRSCLGIAARRQAADREHLETHSGDDDVVFLDGADSEPVRLAMGR